MLHQRLCDENRRKKVWIRRYHRLGFCDAFFGWMVTKRLYLQIGAQKKARFFSLMYFCESLCINRISHNYVIPQFLFCIIMPFRTSFHIPFRKLFPSFTLTEHCYFEPVCLPVKMASETVIRPIKFCSVGQVVSRKVFIHFKPWELFSFSTIFFASAKFLSRYLRNRNLFIFEFYIYSAFFWDKNELDRTYIYRDTNFEFSVLGLFTT